MKCDDKKLIRDLKRRLSRARNFPSNTCPASRHVQMMGDYLSDGRSGRGYPMLQEEPLHCAISMLATVAALYEARTKLAKIEARKQPNITAATTS